MTIAFQAANSAQATSVAIPTHQAGDLLLILTGNNSGFPPTIPSGWNATICSNDQVSPSKTLFVGWKIATSASETSGTWTGSHLIMAAVYRDSTNYHALGGSNRANTRNTTSVVYINISANSAVNTPTKLQNAAAVVFGAIYISENTGVGSAAPSGMTNRAVYAGASTGYLALHDTGSTVSSWSNTTVTAASNVNTVQITVEMMDTGVAKTSGGGGYRPVNVRGGADQ
jgi:hypothetical protein